MSSAGYARCANDSSAAVTDAGPASTEAASIFELASGSPLAVAAIPEALCLLSRDTPSSRAAPTSINSENRPSAIRALFMFTDLLSPVGARLPSVHLCLPRPHDRATIFGENDRRVKISDIYESLAEARSRDRSS